MPVTVPPAKIPLCFPLLPLLRLPALCVAGLKRIVSNQYHKAKRKVKNPIFMRVYAILTVIPTRSCQVCSKQFCLWDLALIIYVVSIIHMVWAI